MHRTRYQHRVGKHIPEDITQESSPEVGKARGESWLQVIQQVGDTAYQLTDSIQTRGSFQQVPGNGIGDLVRKLGRQTRLIFKSDYKELNPNWNYRVRVSVGEAGKDLIKRKEDPELKQLLTLRVPKERDQSCGNLDGKIDSAIRTFIVTICQFGTLIPIFMLLTLL